MKNNTFIHIIAIFVLIVFCGCNRTISVDKLSLCNKAQNKICSCDSSFYYAVETDTIYLSGVIRYAKKDTKCYIKWYYYEKGKKRQEIAAANFVSDGKEKDYPIYAYLYPPKSGWLIGKYQVELSFSDQKSKKVFKDFVMQ